MAIVSINSKNSRAINPKSAFGSEAQARREARNPKQIRNPKSEGELLDISARGHQNGRTGEESKVGSGFLKAPIRMSQKGEEIRLGFWTLGFFSDFGFRASDFRAWQRRCAALDNTRHCLRFDDPFATGA
jgi:hypothetical protein